MDTIPDPQAQPATRLGNPEVAQLVDRLLTIAEAQPPPEETPESAELEVAHEELRVAAEEMRVQQEQINQLVDRYEAERRWRGQLAALVPIGLCTTDGDGKVLDANPALAAQLGVPLARLRGKPLSLYLGGDDARAFRSTLRVLGAGLAAEQHATVHVRGRGQRPATAELFGFSDVVTPLHPEARVQWVLVPQQSPAPGDEAPTGVGTDATLGLAAALAELSALPLKEHDRQRLLGRIAVLTRGAVPAADWVSLTIGSPAQPQRLASDSPEAQAFDGAQMQAAEGPCWQAYVTGATVLTGDVTEDPRWPQLARLARGGAVRSVLALPVHERGDTTGALNVYAGQRDAFGGAARNLGELVAAAVTGVLQGLAEREALQDLVASLETALTSRAVIDQAKGVIMARLGVDAEEAFARLAKLSSRLNVKLRDLAHLVVEGHADEVIAGLRA